MARLSLLLVVVIAVFSPSINNCEASWKDLLIGAVTETFFDSGTVEILDHVCNYNLKSSLKGLELYFKGDVWCPGWTTIKGESFTRSRTRVVNKAVEDFAKKAVAAGLMTEEEAAPLMNA